MKSAILGWSMSVIMMAQNPAPTQQQQIKLPEEVKTAFGKEFPQAHHIVWNSNYREGGELRFEATFFNPPANYLASYDKTGLLKTLEKSLKPGQVPLSIKDYLKANYPTMQVTEASEVVTDQKAKTYEIGLAENKKFMVAVFDPSGAFLFMKSVDD